MTPVNKVPRTTEPTVPNDEVNITNSDRVNNVVSYALAMSNSTGSSTRTPRQRRYVPTNNSVFKSSSPSVSPKEKHVLHFKPILSKKLVMKEDEWPQLRREVSVILSSVKMTFSNFNPKSGVIVLGFPSLQAKQSANALLSDAVELWCYEQYTPDKLLPKLTIHNVPLDFQIDNEDLNPVQIRDLVKDRLWRTLIDKNEGIKDLVQNDQTLDIVYFKKHKYSCTVAIKVSPDIRSYILNTCLSKLYMFSSRCNVTDRCYVKQCFHCQNYGHISKDCKVEAENPTCMYCGDRHESKTCEFKKSTEKHRCCNCKKSRDKTIREHVASHHAGAPDCPSLQLIISRIHKNTHLSVSSKNS